MAASPTGAFVGQLAAIDVGTGFEVVDRPAQILGPGDDVIAVGTGVLG